MVYGEISPSGQDDNAVHYGTLYRGMRWCTARSFPPVRMTMLFITVRCAMERDGVQRDPSRSMP
jgi:hypothetical protein